MRFSLNRNKNRKLAYYVRNIARQFVPSYYFRKQRPSLLANVAQHYRDGIDHRVNYYLKHTLPFSISDKAVAIREFKLSGNSSMYYFDLKEFLDYFERLLKFDFLFGDVTHVEPHATLVKSRPISGANANSVLFKLDKLRHFNFINDPTKFTDKIDKLVWRGNVYPPHRSQFVHRFWNHPLCEVGDSKSPKQEHPWQKEFMSIEQQLQYKFIFCIEGNDVATNLKWAMSSNSLCMMPKPKYETWFMEGTLKEGKHYVELNEDYSDLEEKIQHYVEHVDEAEAIIANAHRFVSQFLNQEREDLICHFVLEKYFKLSGQLGV